MAEHDVISIRECLRLDQATPSHVLQQIDDEVQVALALYSAYIAHDNSAAGMQSASRKVATLSSQLEHAVKLRNGLRNVPRSLRMELTDADGLPISDSEIERICDALHASIERYRDEVTNGRHSVSEALRNTVCALLGIFADHYGGAFDESANSELDFVHRALAAVGIPHPDPDTHESEFADLMALARSSA
ncbi:hypothetical protein RSP799_04040 [Ralstonia solanacearum]|nr:hypothetical protein RSP799_04040 [Ralstonia solanacearum]